MAFTKVTTGGLSQTSNYKTHNVNSTGIITAVKFVGDGSDLDGLQLSKELTIGVRVGAAVTFTVTGSSFNVLNRAGGNVSISI